MSDLNCLRESMDELRDEQQHTAQMCSTMAVTVSKLDRELFGNGRPGLAEKMIEVQTTQKMMLKAMWVIGSALVSIGLGIIGTLLMG